MADRDPWLDNAKMLLVTIVVVGHAMTALPNTEMNQRIYDAIYYFHIPAFVLISGYLSQRSSWSRRHLRGLVTGLLVPYVIFDLAMIGWRILIGDPTPPEPPLLLNPDWPMWYLIVLFLWRLATPILRAHWLMIPASVLVSLAAGTIDVVLFDLNRALGLLPFFVIGLHLPARWLGVARARGARLFGVLGVAGLLWLAGHTDDWISTGWLYWRSPYDRFGVDTLDGAGYRLAMMAIALVGSAAVLALVPRGSTWFTRMGTWTMVVYLFHGFVLKGLQFSVTEPWANAHPEWSGWVVIALSIALAFLLAWTPLASRLNRVVTPLR